jgi:outer membrane immunogenic protein
MKVRLGFVGLTLASVAALASANAADVYPAAGGYKDTPYVQSWTGFYIGVNGGYAWSNHSDKFALASSAFPGIDPQGGFGGGQIGYNWQSGNFVFGVEADIQGSGIEDEARDSAGNVFKSRLDYFGTVRGRLGYAFGPSLLYATGGFAYGGITNDAIAHKGPTPFEFSGTAIGHAIGGGYEYKFNPAWSLKAEWQFAGLGMNDPVFAGVSACTFAPKCEADSFHTFRAGVNYFFGRGYEPLK